MKRPVRAALRLLGAAASVAAVTIVIAQILGSRPSVSAAMLYLVAVLASALFLGRGAAVVTAVGAFLCFNWFFVEPLHHLAVADPSDLLALFVFLLVAAVTGELVAGQRARAEQARLEERDSTLLYEIARDLGADDIRPALRKCAERVRDHLGFAALTIDAGATGAAAIGAGDPAARDILAAAGTRRQLLGPPDATGRPRWIRIAPQTHRGGLQDLSVSTIPLTSGGRRVGAINVASSPDRAFTASDLRLLNSAAAQIATAVDRDELRRRAVEAEVLRRGDDVKNSLLGAVSHDLRTPLASILASASSLRERDVEWTEGEREGFLTDIEAEARRLDRLVGHLLDVSRVQGGSLRPARAWHDAGALVEDVVARIRATAGGRDIATRIPDDLAPGFLDYVEIDQVLTNLIENAVKHAPAGTGVEVGVEPVRGALRFCVEDRGPGLPPDQAARAFEPFTQIASAGREGGVGLGLAIAKRLVEAHGGRIWYEPRPGGGSRFLFTLPRPARSEPPVNARV